MIHDKKTIFAKPDQLLKVQFWPQGYKTFFMLILAEYEICPLNKSQISNNSKFFLAKYS